MRKGLVTKDVAIGDSGGGNVDADLTTALGLGARLASFVPGLTTRALVRVGDMGSASGDDNAAVLGDAFGRG